MMPVEWPQPIGTIKSIYKMNSDKIQIDMQTEKKGNDP